MTWTDLVGYGLIAVAVATVTLAICELLSGPEYRAMTERARRHDIASALMRTHGLGIVRDDSVTGLIDAWMKLRIKQERRLALISAGFTPQAARTWKVRRLTREQLDVMTALTDVTLRPEYTGVGSF